MTVEYLSRKDLPHAHEHRKFFFCCRVTQVYSSLSSDIHGFRYLQSSSRQVDLVQGPGALTEASVIVLECLAQEVHVPVRSRYIY